MSESSLTHQNHLSDSVASEPPLTWAQILLKATGLSLLIVSVLLFLTLLGVGLFAYSRVSEFLLATDLSFTQAKDLVQEGLASSPKKNADKTTFLVLGIDSVANKAGAPPLTDTMLLLTLDYSSGSISALSLPRDLWSSEYKTKINALYYYGIEKYPDSPEQFPTEVLSEMTGVPINYTIVFSLSSVSEIVDILGGIEVDVPTAFIDTEFPREDVIVANATSPEQLYQTVEFNKGIEVMDSERVTQYIRSRHSQGDTGTDVDRSARQQLVLASLVKKITSRQIITNPKIMAELYNWYGRWLSPYLPLTDSIAIAHELFPVRSSVEIQSNMLSIATNQQSGVITHLPVQQTDNQWTYSIVSKEDFEKEVQTHLNL